MSEGELPVGMKGLEPLADGSCPALEPGSDGRSGFWALSAS